MASKTKSETWLLRTGGCWRKLPGRLIPALGVGLEEANDVEGRACVECAEEEFCAGLKGQELQHCRFLVSHLLGDFDSEGCQRTACGEKFPFTE
mmetsp:Transcript_39382/g.78937  ORF Transcript_39382/g.78937 Transcript_39382/m.78937 type:complete len:94 (+) Transcript_39382:117-398(+)